MDVLLMPVKTIADHIFDVLQNSVRAGATVIEIVVAEDKTEDICCIEIKDNGCGMDVRTLEKATDPFFTSRNTRKVGLGLSLLKQKAENANGFFELHSQPGKGTTVKAVFRFSHIDRPPLGEIWDVWYLTVLSYTNIEINYLHSTNKGRFKIGSKEVTEMLGAVPLKNPEIQKAIYELIKNNLIEIETTI